jgi:hypothetical protein
MDPSVVAVTKRRVDSAPDDSVGGGYALFLEFRGVSPGSLTAKYRRPWLKDGDAGAILVTVTDAKVENPLVVRTRKAD